MTKICLEEDTAPLISSNEDVEQRTADDSVSRDQQSFGAKTKADIHVEPRIILTGLEGRGALEGDGGSDDSSPEIVAPPPQAISPGGDNTSGSAGGAEDFPPPPPPEIEEDDDPGMPQLFQEYL